MGLGRCPWTPSPDHCLHWASNLQARPAIKCGYNDKRLDINVGRESECVRVSAAVLMCWLAPAILVTSSALTIRMMIPGRPLDALTSKPKVPPPFAMFLLSPVQNQHFRPLARHEATPASQGVPQVNASDCNTQRPPADQSSRQKAHGSSGVRRPWTPMYKSRPCVTPFAGCLGGQSCPAEQRTRKQGERPPECRRGFFLPRQLNVTPSVPCPDS